MKESLRELEPDPVIDAYKSGIDVTLLRKNLRLSVEERIRQLMELQRFAAEMRRSGRSLAKPCDRL